MKQKIFIGSSGEGRVICDALQEKLSEKHDTSPWHLIFGASGTTIETLVEQLAQFTFGVFVLSADDHAVRRGSGVVLPRDNVVFEAGLFMGMHGRKRTFLVCPSDVEEFHMLTDLSGVTTVRYESKLSFPLQAILPVIQQIERAITAEINAQLAVEVVPTITYDSRPGITWPLKMHLAINNSQAMGVTLSSRSFQFGAEAPQATNDYVLGGSRHNVAFQFGRDKHKKDKNGEYQDAYFETVYLAPGAGIDAWIAFDDTLTEADMKSLHARKKVGVWLYRAVWHTPVPQVREYELAA